ncbi:MAG TPA: hypothetical protein VGH19_18650 [Verrucomicrobiae bacterium]
MTYSNVFFLTEAELDDLDLSRFHEQCNPTRYRNCHNFIAELGRVELHAAGLIALPPDELIPNPIFRVYVKQLVSEWPTYWLFLRLDPPYALYHLAAQCQHVLITNNDADGSYCFSIPAEEIVALLLSQYEGAVAEAAICGAPWAVVIGRLWDVLKSLNIQLFSLVEPELATEHELPYVHVVTEEEVCNGNISKLRSLFAAATSDTKTASVMRGSIRLQYADNSALRDAPGLKAWAGKILTELPESLFLLTLDEHGLIPLIKCFVPKNETVDRLEVTELFHCLMTSYPKLLELERFLGNGECGAIAHLRLVFKRLGYAFCF